jgi:hypothetical protein
MEPKVAHLVGEAVMEQMEEQVEAEQEMALDKMEILQVEEVVVEKNILVFLDLEQIIQEGKALTA